MATIFLRTKRQVHKMFRNSQFFCFNTRPEMMVHGPRRVLVGDYRDKRVTVTTQMYEYIFSGQLSAYFIRGIRKSLPEHPPKKKLHKLRWLWRFFTW